MIRFKSNKILLDSESVAEQLHSARLEKNLKLEDVAKKLNVNLKYLKALEEGEYDKLPVGIYGKNYLREYAQFLGLDYQELLKTFNNKENISQTERSELFSKQVVRRRYFLTTPKIIKNIVIVLIIAICFIYLGYYLQNIISPPKLIINNPRENYTTSNHLLTVLGLTDSGSRVIINGSLVLSDSQGVFFKEVNLKNGINIITITAEKGFGRKSTEVRQVLVKED